MSDDNNGDTRKALLRAAERLIAEHGIAAVSLRAINVAAGQRNHSAAQFHFGSREGLLQGIATERMGPINEQRSRLISELDAAGRNDDVAGLVEALVLPLVVATVGRPGSYYGRFLAVSFADPQWSSAVTQTVQGQGFSEWRQRIESALGHLPKGIRRSRVDRAIASAIMSVASWEGGGGRRGLDLETLVADLQATVVAGLTAPLPAARSGDE
jgi:AcrR family transcriptional regulator